uniref:Uncharacterized protein n=2 Tax=Meloidogyne TaxID=189290 RepID=A0A6V7WX52_MELEN|nr:unnamed protein product [Meloidogyne enterolobii]
MTDNNICKYFLRILPPYRRNIVFILCGMQILFFTIILAIHQAFWLLSTRIFPVAYQMFDDTRNRDFEFSWNKTSRQQLDRYQAQLAVSWVIACVGISISMLCIIPEFCTVEVAAEEEVDLCVRQPSIAKMLTPLLFLCNFLLAACLITEWVEFPLFDNLFHSLFYGAIKEEAYLTSFEEELNCVSDEDKEGLDVWKCDRIIERAILNHKWLNPQLIAQLILTVLSIFVCMLFNDQEKINRGQLNCPEEID